MRDWSVRARLLAVCPGILIPSLALASLGAPGFGVLWGAPGDWIGRATAADIVADGCGNAGVIVGGRPQPLRRFDLRTIGLGLQSTGVVLMAIHAMLGS